jgi:hypothetical protein
VTAAKTMHVHGESMRMGARIIAYNYTGKPQPDDMLVRILTAAKPSNVLVDEFPLEVLTQAHQIRKSERRRLAERAMEILLAKAGEPDLITRDMLEAIASKAWLLASLMEGQENLSIQLDSLKDE